MASGKADLTRLISGVLLILWSGQSTAFELVDVSGSLGYTYRTLTGSTNSDATSNQLRTAIRGQGYLWQPWFATVTAGLRVTQDSSEYDRTGMSTDTTLVTGDLDLNILSQSRTPFSLSYSTSDSRVDDVSLPNTVTSLGGQEFTTRRLAVRQSFFTNAGDRLQVRYDRNTWESRGREEYLDQLVGAEVNIRRPRHTLVAKGSYQEIERERTTLDQQTDTVVANIDHYYHPNRALRVDSLLSYYGSETAAPDGNPGIGESTLDLSQLSSFLFWRPESRPLSMSAGIRIYGLSGESSVDENEQTSVSATSGLFYQWTKHLRVDANVEGTVIDNDDGEDRTESSRQRIGALYQSDLREIYAGMTYNWYASGAVQNRDIDDETLLSADVRLGHDAQRLWLTDGNGTIRLSFSQTASADQTSGDEDDLTTQRLDHSGSISWDRYSEAATTMVQLTLADSRGFGDREDEQQFANLQLLRTQTISLRSQLSGNLTVQMVRRDFNGISDDDTVATTGQVNYLHRDLFNIAQLRFLSDLRISQAALDEGIDRSEWENRLSYAIGLLDTSASWRYINLDNEEKYSLVYFQINRRF